MTHISNVAHILKNGITHWNSPNANPNYQAIGDVSLISRRANFRLNNGRKISEYIPFYFGPRMPMQYVIQHGFNEVPKTNGHDIVFCVLKLQSILDLGLEFVFTNGHAVSQLTECYTAEKISELPHLIDFEAVNAKYWVKAEDQDLKRRKEAEFLVIGDIPNTVLIHFGVNDSYAKEKLVEMGVEENKVSLRPNWYF